MSYSTLRRLGQGHSGLTLNVTIKHNAITRLLHIINLTIYLKYSLVTRK